MTIKDIFDKAGEDGTLTYEQFESLMKDGGAKFADLSDGKYVSKSKYDTDLKAKDAEIEAKVADITNRDEQITNLNDTIATRDTDLANLQKQLEEAGQDATKLAELGEQITGLQTKYDTDVQNYQNQLKQQAYEFAVKEYANTKNFSSQAAKRDFVQSMIARGLQMDGDKILGRDDFADAYFAENADALVPEKAPEPNPDPVPEPSPEPAAPKVTVPELVAPTPGPAPDNEGNEFHFNFTGVRAH